MLKKYLLFILLCISLLFFTPVFANENTPPAEREKAYTLTPTEAKGDNTITKYEVVDNKLVPTYYKLDLTKTEYGDPSGDTTKQYEWSKDAKGNNNFAEVSTPIDGKQTITVKYNSATNQRRENTNTSGMSIYGNFVGQNVTTSAYSKPGGAINNSGVIGNIVGDFVGNYFSSSYLYSSASGGAIYNSGTIADITGNFIGNYAFSSSDSNGGAIYNSINSKIGNITGDFIGNYASSSSSPSPAAYGGAIYNYGTIGNITGDFIGNYASSSSPSSYVAKGGAIYNDRGKIGNIIGDFVGNYASFSSNDTQGGAIYNSGTIGDITGDFVGNYVSGSFSTQGGAIYNDYGGSIGNIIGDFIGNYVSGSHSTQGGAIYNSGTIGDITGDFVGNYASTSSADANGGAIYNGGSIRDITGDFIGNYAVSSSSSSAHGGAIYNNKTIGNITGDFVGNYASSSSADANGGAIYNYNGGSIGNIIGDFIGNYVSASYDTHGGAIYNNKTIGNITGDFVGNYLTGSYSGSTIHQGGAIYNSGAMGRIKGNFIGNYAGAKGLSEGGAIYNSGTIDDINGDFIENYASGYSMSGQAPSGGGIYNSGKIKNLTGNFIGNNAGTGGAVANTGTIGNITADFVDNFSSRGGAIANYILSRGAGIKVSIGKITGNFVGNHGDLGGAIFNSNYLNTYNYGEGLLTIDDITGNFVGNYAESGGAIYNKIDSAFTGASTLKIGNIKGDFIGNYAFSAFSDNVQGGAIFNSIALNYGDGSVTIGDITGNFIGNYASHSRNTNSSAQGGAISNNNIARLDGIINASIGDIRGDFIDNYAASASLYSYSSDSASAQGGAIYNYNATIGSKDVSGNVIGGIINSSFINNYAKAEAASSSATAQGGAIYTNSSLNIIADNGTSLFSGNKTIVTTNKGSESEQTIEDQNAIYVDSDSATLTLNAKNNGIIHFEDKIGGKEGYNLNLTGDESGAIILNNSVDNANVTAEKITLSLGKHDVFATSDVSVNSTSIILLNGAAEQQAMKSLNVSGNTNLALDVDLASEKMDTLPNGTTLSNGARLNVNYLNLLSDATKNHTDIRFASPELAQHVAYTGATPIAYTPIYKYDVSYNPMDGMFSFVGGPNNSSPNNPDNYNPSVLAPSVATQTGAYTTQLQTFNYAFQHADTFMNIPYLDRLAIKNQNKYALSPTGDATDVGVFSPLFTKNASAGIWFKPYASFESVPLKNGPKVSNINYGSLVGFDSNLKTIKHGFDRVITGYIGYNGASQRYQGVDAYQNGGILGSTFTFYKRNFFNATTVSVGATAGNANNMYGSENYTMLLAGIANKAGYNFEFKEGKIILQPSMLISYTFVNTFDYNNAAGLKIKADPLNAIQLAPGLKLIGNTKNGWQPYLGINMIWNLLDETKVTANDVRLPEMSIKPYVQYGVGLQRNWDEHFTAYGQAMIHSGGRNGVSLSAGLRWAIGKK